MPDLRDDAVIGIVAGGGALPNQLRAHLASNGRTVRTIALAGEATVSAVDATHPIGDVEGILRSMARFGVTHAVLVGWVRRRPSLWQARVGPRALPAVPTLLRNLGRGDDAILRAAIRAVESTGIAVVGVHELWPELVAQAGPLGRRAPGPSHRRTIEHGAEVARVLGAYDIGQGVVAQDGRVIAVEGVEGTDGMLRRIAAMRSDGVVARPGGVLVKMCKPQQERRADLPSIGPDTIRLAAEAGLDGVAVEATRSLVIDRNDTIRRADDLELFVYGVEPS